MTVVREGTPSIHNKYRKDDIKAVCKLGFLAALGLLHGVPEGGTVLV